MEKTPMEQEREFAESKGFEAEPNNYSWFVYKRGPMRVWKIRRGNGVWWQTAALIDNRYQDHQPFPTLDQALDHAWMEAWTWTGE